MTSIGKKILTLRTGNSQNKIQRGALIPFKEAESVGILYTWEGQQKEGLISQFVTVVGDHLAIDCLCFNADKKITVDSVRPILNIGDLTMFGKINSIETDSFIQKPFDYLFHLDFNINEITEAILKQSHAKCRIGPHTDQSESLYELMIGINQSSGFENLTEQMLKYVNALK